MSLLSWIICYVVGIGFFGWIFSRDRELEKERTRLGAWLLAIVIFTSWFVIGLIYPEARLFIFAQPD